MLDELVKNMERYQAQRDEMHHYLQIESYRQQLSLLEKAAREPDFWNDQAAAQKNIAQTRALKQVLDPFDKVCNGLEDAAVLLELAEGGEEEAAEELQLEVDQVGESLRKLELQSLLGEEFDGNNAYLTLHAGAGGTESCDWADMLQRMYLRYAEKKGFKAQVLDMQNGDEAGIKSVSLHIQGTHAYGLLKSRAGSTSIGTH